MINVSNLTIYINILIGVLYGYMWLQDDEVREKLETLQDELCELPDVQCMKGNLQGFYEVDNNAGNNKQYDEIIQAIINAAVYQKQWEKIIPAKWLLLEEAMMRKKVAGTKVLTFEEVKQLDSTCGVPIKDEKEIKLFLRYVEI